MYAHMGMKIEEREDGQVNIGIAVCPTKPTAIIAPTEHGRNDMLLSHTNGNVVVIPKSAFIIRTPDHYQSQGGISVAYAHHLKRPSNFIIMLGPQDQGYQNRISELDGSTETQSGDTIVAEGMKSIERNGKEVSSEKFEVNFVDSENGMEQVEKNEANSQETHLQDGMISKSREPDNLTTPQNTDKAKDIGENLPETTLEKKATGTEESVVPTKRSGDMKRVSWLEDIEKFEEKKGSGKDTNENKKNSNCARKSNGVGTYNNRTTPTKKQQGVSSEGVRNKITEGYTKVDKRSGDRSRIPLIAASAGDYPTSCEFYRRQMLRECIYNPSTMADNWYGYTSIQKYAGQKVVKKIAAEQKRLEEDISNRRKTEIWILGNETDDFISPSCTTPLRKKTMRLKPMQIVQ